MLNLIFCIHNHQPVGNFDHVLEDAYSRAYEPFLKKISKFPSIKLTLHTSGFLLDWLCEKQPAYIDLLAKMVDSKQVEILGGGFYEPVLAVIPEADRVGQIQMMSERVDELFGVRPRGLWLAERVWDPTLPKSLKDAGVEYVIVDDYHFIRSGLKKEELGGYYISEDQGSTIKVFPGSERLRYLIPFAPVDAFVDHINSLEGNLKGRAAIFADDGEKLGVWPGTDKWVYGEGWFESFLEKIESFGDTLKSVTFSEYIDSEEPLGRVYLPTTSYMEMGEWSLPAHVSKEYGELRDAIKGFEEGEKVLSFLQGGTWRNFFSKYPEANWMHKRMLKVSKEIGEASKSSSKYIIKEAKKHLYMAQSNDAYWHGVFGGLYLPHLRTAVFENLLKAETLLEKNPLNLVSTSLEDFDCDGFDEVIIKANDINLFFSPRMGGALMAIEAPVMGLNLTNVISRWFEGYHMKLKEAETGLTEDTTKSIHDRVVTKEEGLVNYLNFDSQRRASLVDHFLRQDESFDSFIRSTHGELTNLQETPYEQKLNPNGLTLKGQGRVMGSAFEIVKDVTITGEASFSASYSLSLADVSSLESSVCNFGVEFNLMLPCCDGPACYLELNTEVGVKYGLGERAEHENVKKIMLYDTFTGVKVTIKTSVGVGLWRFPIETVSLSEAGFERNYQGTSFLFFLPIEIRPSSKLDLRFDFVIEKI